MNAELIKNIGSSITIIIAIIGVWLSVMNFKTAKLKESESRKIEAAKPFLELRQKLYLEALHASSVLASKNLHTETEIEQAKKRFMELYWGELSLVEEAGIEKLMVAIATKEHLNDTVSALQREVYDLAHTMRSSLVKSWGVDTTKIGKINP